MSAGELARQAVMAKHDFERGCARVAEIERQARASGYSEDVLNDLRLTHQIVANQGASLLRLASQIKNGPRPAAATTTEGL